MLRTSQALKLGIHPRTLYKLREAGEVDRIGRGIYRLARARPLTNPDWVPIALKFPRADLSDLRPRSSRSHHPDPPRDRRCATEPRTDPQVDDLPIRVFWFSKRAFRAGVAKIRIDGVPVRIYSPEKTLADCFKYRNKIGLDIAVEALREYRRRTRKPDMKAILKFASVCRVSTIMRPYLEALL
jgi:predicted transcriptional regulator of viral defense system